MMKRRQPREPVVFPPEGALVSFDVCASCRKSGDGVGGGFDIIECEVGRSLAVGLGGEQFKIVRGVRREGQIPEGCPYLLEHIVSHDDVE